VSQSDPSNVHFKLDRNVWYAAFVAPALGTLIWLAFDFYGQMRALQLELGAKKADCAVIEDRQSTCVLMVGEDRVGRCVFNETRLKPRPP
jgi:hypothetical protein